MFRNSLLPAILVLSALVSTLTMGQETGNPDRSAKLKERDHQWKAAQEAKAKGDFATAIKAGEATLQIDLDLLGENHRRLITTLSFLAECEERRENWDAAETQRKEIARRASVAFGQNDYRAHDANRTLQHLETLRSLTPEQRQALVDAQAMNGRMLGLSRKAEFASAIELAQQSLQIRETILGPEHPDTATTLNNLASFYKSQGNYALAEPLHQRALKIREKALGSEHPDTANSLNNLALLYYSQGIWASAIPLLQQALKIREKVLGPEHPDTAISLNSLAAVYNSQGNDVSAEPLYHRALKIQEKVLGREHPDTAISLNNLAVLYKSQGDHVSAESLLQRAVKIQEKALGPEHPGTANSLNNLAALYQSQGMSGSAEPLLIRALRIREKALGPEHPDTAISVNGLAELYKSQGNYLSAEPLYQRVLNIREKALGPDHAETVNSLNNLAALYQSYEMYGSAEALRERALKINEKVLGPEHPVTAMSLNDLGSLSKSQRDDTAAESLYQRALKIQEKVLGPEHPDAAISVNNLAMLYAAQGNNTAAEQLYQRALKINEKALGFEHPATASSLKNSAVFNWNQGRDAAARPLMVRSAQSTIERLDRAAMIQTEAQQFLMSKPAGSTIAFYLTFQETDPAAVTQTWSTLLDWKRLITARQTRLRRALKDDPEYLALQQVTRQLNTQILNPPRPPNDPKLIAAWNEKAPALLDDWQEERIRLETERERIEETLSDKSELFRSSIEQQYVRVGDIQQLLASQKRSTALVDLIEYEYQTRGKNPNERRIAAFVVRGDRVTRVELRRAKEIHSLIRQWRKALGRGEVDEKAAATLCERLWQPLSAALDGAQVVVISPDGELGEFPWGALPGTKSGTYLLEEISIAVIPVPQMLPQLLENEPVSCPPKSLLIAGDIDYGGDAGKPGDPLALRATNRSRDGNPMQFEPLPAAEAEMSSIQVRYGDSLDGGEVHRLLQAEATEAAFRLLAPKHQWLHVVTHGYFAPDLGKTTATGDRTSISTNKAAHPGLLSGLALAGANTPAEEGKDDGILTALEVSALDLSNVETVVLSACETGLGAVAGGEGLLGLQRAFQVAGAKTTVASLWKVPDRATATLMQRFYENLWDKKMGKLEALRAAQIWMLRDNGNRGLVIDQQPAAANELPPYYWAAFVLSGDWR